MSVFRLLVSRILFSALTLLLVSILIFLILEALPGDVATRILGREATAKALEVLRSQLHLDQPAPVRYFQWLGDFLRGDLGTSIATGRPIADVLGPRIVNTLLLSLLAFAIYLVLALVPAIIQAVNRGKTIDNVISVITLLLLSLPDFLLATMLLFLFAVTVPILPALATISENSSWLEMLRAMVLPAVTLAIMMAVYAIRVLRDSLIEVLRSDYVRLAELKGLRPRAVLFRHALPNAIVPALNVTALNLGFLIGGVVIVERVFSYPGFGTLLIDALQLRDIPLIKATVMISAAVYVVANLVADVLAVLEIVGLIESMGFVPVARHRSKSVTVYQQGGIRIVVNTETAGYAGASYNFHGTTAYAIGLQVSDAAGALTRALGLGAGAFTQPPGPSETAMPAIYGPGGGVIYFIDASPWLSRIWETEFEPVEHVHPGAPAGLLSIDHIAQTVEYGELPTAVLFYTSILAMEKTPVFDVIDPAGMVRSQVVADPAGGLRITLNGSENRRTLAGHFIAENFGPAIQHIAFQTANIFATADALARNGFKSLKISRNYYDDVEARFGLNTEFTDSLRTANILYDRDEHGEYFQLYSSIYGEGFFFEIVERRGYCGYGAANAIFRIAAQKRQIRPDGVPADTKSRSE